jgi:O-antigen/teichoic acid export membrane protein
MNDKRKVFLNSAAVTAATIIDNAIFFVINVLISRYLSKEHYGEYSTALGYATFFACFTNIGINSTLQRMVAREPKNAHLHFGNIIAVKTTLALVFYSALAASLHFTNYSASTVSLTLIMGLFRIGNEYHSTFFALFDAQERFVISLIFKLTFGFFFLIGTITIIHYKGNYFDLAWFRFLLVAVYILLLIFFSFRSLRPVFDKRTIPTFLHNAAPFAASSIISNFLQRINIIMLSLIHGSVYAGTFTNGYMFFSTLLFIPANMTRVLLPFLYRVNFKTDRLKFQFAFDFYSKYLYVAGFYIMITMILFSKQIITLIFGIKYADSIPVLQIAAMGIPFTFIITPTIIAAIDKQKIVTLIQFASLLFNLAANAVCISFWKSEGAAVASTLTVAFSSTLFLFYLANRKILSIKNHVYCFLKLSGVSVFCVAVWYFQLRASNLFLSIGIVTACFFFLSALLLVKKEDLRVFMEIIGR